MFRKEDDPPAIVKEADFSVSNETTKIKESWVRYQARGREMSHEGQNIGESLSKIKARMPGKFRDFVRTSLPFTYDHARRLVRLFESNRDREKQSGAAPDDISLSERLAHNLKILCDDEVTSNGDVPFALPEKPKTAVSTAPDREAGDEREYDELAAKIEAKLCDACKRKGGGQPLRACDKCMGMAARLRAGENLPEKPAAPTPAKPKEDPNNGTPLFDWEGYRKDLTKYVGRINSFGRAYQCLETGVLEKARDKLLEAHDEFRKAYETVAKQKVPDFTFFDKVQA